MSRVLDYIDQRFADPIELATLAKVAHFSRFHFHGVITFWKTSPPWLPAQAPTGGERFEAGPPTPQSRSGNEQA